MGRYFDDKISTTGLEPSNPFFGPVRSAANAVNQAETEFFQERRDLFKELNGGDKPASAEQVERDYEDLGGDIPIYNFRDVFDFVNPSKRTSTAGSRYVYVPYELTTFESGFANLFDVDGDAIDDVVLDYQLGQGKVNIDTLYTNLRVYTTSSRVRGYYEDDAQADSAAVFESFGEVPNRWNAKSGYTSRQLQVFNVAGHAYEDKVDPKINKFNANLQLYIDNGGGELTSDFYEGTLDFPYEGYTGPRNSYNRPNNLSAALIKQSRGVSG